jgi:hypothetical protein
MRKSIVFLCCGLLMVLVAARPIHAEATKYVEITKPFANIYRFLDPKSELIKLAKRGEFYELVYEGTSWYQIKIKESVGWLEHTNGVVTEAPKFLFFSVSFWIFMLFVILVVGALGGISYLIYRQKSAES